MIEVENAMPTREYTKPPLDPDALREVVVREVSSWKGVSVHAHRYGGVELRIARQELGHLHPKFADLPFPRPIRDELVASGRARPHHILPDSGWVTVPMRNDSEAAGVVELFRLNYNRVCEG
jgi:Luciferase